MTDKALTVHQARPLDFETLQRISKAMFTSGFFKDVRDVSQAIVKVQAGAELGLPPFASMSGIHIIKGKAVLGANVIATLIANDRRYAYRIKTPPGKEAELCVIEFLEDGQAVGQVNFTMQEAQAAGLTGKDNWKKYPSDMLFARAISRGARRYAPGIFGGAPVYTPDEMDVSIDEDGVIDGIVLTEPNRDNGAVTEVSSTEQIIRNSAADFVPTAVRVIKRYSSGKAVTGALKRLGYDAIPGNAEERVQMFDLLVSYANLRDGGMDQGAAVDAVMSEAI